MRKNWSLTQDGFETLLAWLSLDREKAGIQYETIRKRLIRLFTIRGCVDPEAMSDETINRVISRLPDILPAYTGDPIHYFYGVANKVHQESLSSRRRKEEQLDPILHERYFGASLDGQPESESTAMALLKECLKRMSKDSRDLIVEYFAEDKGRPDHRRLLAEKAGINLNVLRIKVLRIKKKLSECISAKTNGNGVKRSTENVHYV